jgi:TolA-binding protein
VRDILFGNQVREFERRFARLEERMLKETSDLKADVWNRVGALEEYTKKEMESLTEHLKADHDDRVESDATLSREIKDSAASLARRITTVDEQLAKSQRELRQQILEQNQRLSDDIRKKMDEVLATLANEAQTLRSDKADRATLAALLTEMAMRLTNDFPIPDAEGNA